ncbi:MAG: PaaI family thioesterase [Actinobacteria bacterium]|nr:MAG: PaaI family thioesterase [Actinomycetota bacterium]
MADAHRAAGDGTVPGKVAGRLAERIGLEFLELDPSRVVARIPVEGNTQPYGILHGGATAMLCETVASIGTALAVGMEKQVMGIELNVNHIGAVKEGHVTAIGMPLHVGRSTAVWDVKVHDDESRLIAAGRLTLVIREPRRDE